MFLTILFVAAACMTLMYTSWVIGFHMSHTGYGLAKRFYPFKFARSEGNDSSSTRPI